VCVVLLRVLFLLVLCVFVSAFCYYCVFKFYRMCLARAFFVVVVVCVCVVAVCVLFMLLCCFVLVLLCHYAYEFVV